MLKLEKSKNALGFTLRLREKDRFFESQLLAALGIALFMHVGGFLVFHISPFMITSNFIFSPIEVQSEQPQQDISVFAQSSVKDEAEFAPPPIQMIPTLDWIFLPRETALAASVSLDPQAFHYLENHLWPTWHEPLSIPLEEPLVQLAISGNLASRPLVQSDPLLEEKRKISSKERKYAHVHYQVQLNERTGDIFWYEKTQSSGRADVDRLTEKILLNLKFDPNSAWEDVQGVLNFTIAIS